MNIYGEAGKIEEVLRIWNLYMRSTEQCDNNDYLKVIRLLLKLDDIFGAEEIYKVWESLPLEFDIRIPTTLASGYRKRGMVDEADKLMNSRIIKYRRMNKPINPLLDQWGSRMRMSELKCLIKNLHDSNQFSKALQVCLIYRFTLLHIIFFELVKLTRLVITEWIIFQSFCINF